MGTQVSLTPKPKLPHKIPISPQAGLLWFRVWVADRQLGGARQGGLVSFVSVLEAGGWGRFPKCLKPGGRDGGREVRDSRGPGEGCGSPGDR